MAQSTWKLCSAPGCERKARTKGATYCTLHGMRIFHHGSLDDPRTPLSERFWSKVVKTDGCWFWIASAFVPQGYGAFMYAHRDKRYAHRVAYELSIGPIPEGLTIDHLCFNRLCVRPDHLEVVTQGVNTRRAVERRERKKHGRPEWSRSA